MIYIAIIIITAAVIGRFVWRKSQQVRRSGQVYFTPAWIKYEQAAQEYWNAKKN